MTNIDEKLLKRLENLSMLEIEESKREEFLNSLKEIVGFVENLNELDLENEEASFTTLKGGTPFRKDEPKKTDIIEDVLKNAPKREKNFFVVPKIIQ